jgi:hypothetical protein
LQIANWKTCAGGFLHFAICNLQFAIPSYAGPSQDDVLRSIGSKVDERISGTKILATAIAIVSVIVLLVLISRRQTERTAPKTLNHQGKLVKEILRQVPIKPAEMRKIKTLAAEQQCSPLTLLLCPSVLAKAMKERRQN